MNNTTYFDKLKENGFVVGKNIIPQEEIIKVTNSLKKTLKNQITNLDIEYQDDNIYSLLKLLHKIDIETYKKVLGTLWRKFDVYQFMHSKYVVNFVKDTMNWDDLFVPGGQVVHIMAEALKIPNGYFGVHPHQDFPSVQGSLDGLVAWVPLVNVGKQNFSMDVLPKSHIHGVLPTNQDSHDTWKVDPNTYNESEFYTVEANAGDIVLMTNFTLHRSSILGDEDKYRLAISTRFDNADESTFIDRCYPSAYIRNIERKQYFENFPTKSDVKKVWK